MEEVPVRKNLRLKDYDYSGAGYYFLTICVKDRHEMLGTIDVDVGAISNRPLTLMKLSNYGRIVQSVIQEIPVHYAGVTVDKYVIMPNHVHMILIKKHGRLLIAPTGPPATVSRVMKQLKRQVSKKIGFSLWQRSYHDHIIRDEAEYQRIWHYIDENPEKWETDCYFKK